MMSHMVGFELDMSCFMRSTISPGLYLPARMSANSRSDCSMGLERSFESCRGPWSLPPRCAEISSAASRRAGGVSVGTARSVRLREKEREREGRTRVVARVGKALLDEEDGEVVQLGKVVARVRDLVRLVAEPAHVLEDLVEVDLLLGLGVGVVVAQVAVALVVLGEPKVDGDRLRVPDLRTASGKSQHNEHKEEKGETRKREGDARGGSRWARAGSG